jgi:hypothetical protein
MDAAEFLGEYPSLAPVRRHCIELRWLGRFIIGATLDDPTRHTLRELVHHPASAILRDLTLRNVSDSALEYIVQQLLDRPFRFAHLRTFAVQGMVVSPDPEIARQLPHLCWIAA